MPEQDQPVSAPPPHSIIHIHGWNVLNDADQFAETGKLEKLIMKNLNGLGSGREEK